MKRKNIYKIFKSNEDIFNGIYERNMEKFNRLYRKNNEN